MLPVDNAKNLSPPPPALLRYGLESHLELLQKLSRVDGPRGCSPLAKRQLVKEPSSVSRIEADLNSSGCFSTMVGVVITIRLIRDFEYRNVKLMVMRDVDLTCSGAELKTSILKRVAEESAFVTLRRSDLNTLKIHQLSAHQYKDQNLVVNLDRDDWVIEDSDRLEDKGVRAEAEISFYNDDAYRSFKRNPVVKW